MKQITHPSTPLIHACTHHIQLEKYSDATFMQDSIASVAGAVASITVAQPLDVIKTRIQKRDFTCVVVAGRCRFLSDVCVWVVCVCGRDGPDRSHIHTHTPQPIHPLNHSPFLPQRPAMYDSDKTSGTRILTDLVKNEGLGAFFKGLTPKLVVIGPKLVFSFTVAQVSP